MRHRILSALSVCATVACSSPDPPLGDAGDAGAAGPDAGADLAGAPDGPAPTVRCDALAITGDARSAAGARWTYQSLDADGMYALEGLLLTPAGAGPFPGVVISHGKGGLPTGYAANVGRRMVGWGMVVIATRYTHAADNDGRNATLAPAGPDGASEANVARAHKARALLSCLGYVDMTRLSAHGHSMGAFVTGQILGTHTTDFRAASHTAGGVSSGPNATSPAAAARIVTPYQMHHGDADTVVRVELDRALEGSLKASGAEHELHVYAGYSHAQIADDAAMLERVRAWYRGHGVLP